MARETRTLAGEVIEIRGQRLAVPVRTQHVAGVIVSDEEKKIRFSLSAGRNALGRNRAERCTAGDHVDECSAPAVHCASNRNLVSLPDCKPVSVPLARRQPFIWAAHY